MAHQQRAIQNDHNTSHETIKKPDVTGFYIILDFELAGEVLKPTDVTYTWHKERALECFGVDCEEVVAVMVFHAPLGVEGPLLPVVSSGPVPLPWHNCTIGMLEALSVLKAQEGE